MTLTIRLNDFTTEPKPQNICIRILSRLHVSHSLIQKAIICVPSFHSTYTSIYAPVIIDRANVWDGALRGFKRSTYDPTNAMMVRFTDDVGQMEEALDTGGPTREFLTVD